MNCLFDERFTPLHYACLNGNYKITKLLLENKANVNAQNKLLKTPLHLAAQFDPDQFDESEQVEEGLKIVKLLLEYNADPNILNAQRKLPLDCACDNRIKDILEPVTKNTLEQSLSQTK